MQGPFFIFFCSSFCRGLYRMESSDARTCRCVTAAASVQLSDALCIQIAFSPQVPNFQQPSLRLRRSPMHKMIDWPKVHTCQKFKPDPLSLKILWCFHHPTSRISLSVCLFLGVIPSTRFMKGNVSFQVFVAPFRPESIRVIWAQAMEARHRNWTKRTNIFLL